MSYKTINISMPETMKQMVEEEVKSGNFASTSDFIRDLVRDYLENKRIEKLVLAGIRDEKVTPLTRQDFLDLKRELVSHISEDRKVRLGL